MDPELIEQLETEESMFGQTARGITGDGATPDVVRRHSRNALLLRSTAADRRYMITRPADPDVVMETV